jgi:hypothetical protein
VGIGEPGGWLADWHEVDLSVGIKGLNLSKIQLQADSAVAASTLCKFTHTVGSFLFPQISSSLL